tara:strand:+ start:21055 stop:21177 length:123 start_codon:yes stop_codon:yes gene_type:complete
MNYKYEQVNTKGIRQYCTNSNGHPIFVIDNFQQTSPNGAN